MEHSYGVCAEDCNRRGDMSPFVKLDTRILDSTLWLDAPASRVFITALLMAEPWDLTEPMAQIEVRGLKPTGFVVPAGWYGFIPAAGIGIIRRSMLSDVEGYAALEALGSADPESRSPEFEGRRLVRVDGGYIILNFIKYRDRDYGAADRMKRLRERKKTETVTPNVTPVRPNVTQAEAEAETETEQNAERREKAPSTGVDASLPSTQTDIAAQPQPRKPPNPEAYVAYWNRNCGPLPTVRKLTDERRLLLQERIDYGLTPKDFKEIVAKMKASPFCLGKNDRRQKMTIDFVIENDTNIEKILEGKYEEAAKPKQKHVYMDGTTSWS